MAAIAAPHRVLVSEFWYIISVFGTVCTHHTSTVPAMILWTKDGERLLAFFTFLDCVGIRQAWNSVYPTGTTTHVCNGKKAMESAGGKKVANATQWLGLKTAFEQFYEIFLVDILYEIVLII